MFLGPNLIKRIDLNPLVYDRMFNFGLILNDGLVIGSPFASNRGGYQRGSVYYDNKTINSKNDYEWFGYDIVKHNGSVYVGAPGYRIEGIPVGAVYIYKDNVETIIKGKSKNSQFGKSIAVNDKHLVIGSPSYSGY